MGKILRFDPRRRARRWRPGAPREKQRSPRRRWWRLARPGLGPAALFFVLAGLWIIGGDRLARAATEMMPGGAERVDARFGRCPGAFYCVVDGDTIRIGPRRIRLTGFDTPEKDARCQAEARAAERATGALQDWLNRGPFVMTVSFGTARVDRYGRDLREVLRDQGRTMEALSSYMVENNFARAYGGGTRVGWC